MEPQPIAEGKPRPGAWERVVAVNERLWQTPTRVLEIVGEHVQLLSRAVFWLLKPPFRWSVFVEALEFIGVQSLVIVTLIGTFVGMVFALQLTSALRQFGT